MNCSKHFRLLQGELGTLRNWKLVVLLKEEREDNLKKPQIASSFGFGAISN